MGKRGLRLWLGWRWLWLAVAGCGWLWLWLAVTVAAKMGKQGLYTSTDISDLGDVGAC